MPRLVVFRKSHLSGLEWQQLCVATNVCPGGDGHRLGSNHWMLTKTHGRDGHARLIICWSVGHILYTMSYVSILYIYIYVYTYMYIGIYIYILHMNTYTDIHIYRYTYIQIHIYIYIDS